jgi:hypothetical protein
MTTDLGHDVKVALLRWIDQGLHLWPQLSRWPLEARGLRKVVSREWRKHIVAQLWDCTEILPDAYCHALKLPVGSTYGGAVRSIWFEHLGEEAEPAA